MDEPERPQLGELWEIHDPDDWEGFKDGKWPTKLVYVVAVIVEHHSNRKFQAIDIETSNICYFREVVRARRVA